MNAHTRRHFWATIRDVATDPYFILMLAAAFVFWVWDTITCAGEKP